MMWNEHELAKEIFTELYKQCPLTKEKLKEVAKTFEVKLFDEEPTYAIKVYDGSDITTKIKCVASKNHLTEEKAYSLAKQIAEKISDVYGRSCVEIFEEYHTEDGVYLELYDTIVGPYNPYANPNFEDLLEE